MGPNLLFNDIFYATVRTTQQISTAICLQSCENQKTRPDTSLLMSRVVWAGVDDKPYSACHQIGHDEKKKPRNEKQKQTTKLLAN